jgi:hypothetical protein
MPEEKDLNMLTAKAGAAKIDVTLFRVIADSGAWRLRK